MTTSSLPTPPKRVYVRTFGCQMNEHDSNKIRAMLAAEGYSDAHSLDNADLILFNTCTIREKAHHKAMSEIGRTALLKQRHPKVIVGVCGCVAQEEKEALFDRYPHIDILFGPDQIWCLPKLLKEVEFKERAFALDLVDDPQAYHLLDNDFSTCSFEAKPSVFISIMKGCNCACSYCIVPSVRGREVCRDPDGIIAEIRKLALSGTKEVTLLGQNVNAYEFGATTFSRLLRKIAEETGILRIRFTSPHPRDAREDLIREYAENEKLMPHIHLPVQAGSDDVLKKMRRGYTRKDYIDICKRLREAQPGISITTDLIVGFCGETSLDFGHTLALMREVEFDSAFAFKYSPRPGTEAMKKFADDVSLNEKDKRLAILLSLQLETSRRKNEKLIGQMAKVLVIGTDRMKRGLLTGRLPDNRIVHFAGKEEMIGTIVSTCITKAYDNSLAGELAEELSL